MIIWRTKEEVSVCFSRQPVNINELKVPNIPFEMKSYFSSGQPFWK